MDGLLEISCIILLEEYKVMFEDGSIDYISKSDIDGVNACDSNIRTYSTACVKFSIVLFVIL